MTRTILALGSAMLLILGACGGGATATAPAASVPAASAPAASAPASEAPASEPAASESAAAGGPACAASTEAGTVTASIANFAFDPTPVTASVGDVVAWTNNDGTAHTATVKSDTTCSTANLNNGETGAIVFNVAGSYDIICKIHSNMAGKVEVS
jgi:plastocyanin